jgi:hypothetical protein
VPYDGGGFKTLNVQEMEASANYPLVISTVVPRPIGFLSTVSKDGNLNLSPYSYFGAMGHDPPLVRESHSNRHPHVCGIFVKGSVGIVGWKVHSDLQDARTLQLSNNCQACAFVRLCAPCTLQLLCRWW